MPKAPPRICTYPGCGALTTTGRCARHPHKQRSRRTQSYKHLYNTARWKKGRKIFLLNHPLCERCMERGRSEQATVVDHIRPHHGNTDLFFDQHNWQGLCKSCHDRKTATTDGGFGNK